MLSQEVLESAKITSQDLWKHRSEMMRCRTCISFVAKETLERPETALGRCSRHAPTMQGYPVVYEIDWCGDHKLDENKV